MKLSEGTSRTLRILNKATKYLMPKPEEDLDAESAEEHCDLPEQSSESFSDDSSSETTESSCESYNVDEDESSEEQLSLEEETETGSMVERAPTTPGEVSSILTEVLGEDISQISESDYQTTLASTSSACDVVNTVQGYDNIEDDMQQFATTIIVPENGNSTQSISGRSRLLSLKENTKGRIRYKIKKKYKNVLTVFSKISKMRRWSPKYIVICNHSIKKSSASVTFGK